MAPEDINIEDIQRFYNSDALHRLQSLMCRESLLEICRMRTWETAHSAFLKWLFTNEEFNRLPLSPIVTLLRLYAANAYIQDSPNKQFAKPELLEKLLSGGIKSVTSVVGGVELSTSNKRRIDIQLSLKYLDNSVQKEIRICVENKMFSKEHTDQCAEYYNHYEQLSDNIPTLFIFLSPDSSNVTKDPHYVHLLYQELYDSVLYPLYKHYRGHHSKRAIFYLKEYMNSLTSINEDYNPIVMSNEYKNLLKQIYENHRDLFFEVINECGTDDEKKAVKAATGGNIVYAISNSTTGNAESVSGFTKMARRVVELLLQNNIPVSEINTKLGKVNITGFDSTVADLPENKGASSRYSRRPIEDEQTNTPILYVSNQWNRDKADLFIKKIEENYPFISITQNISKEG
ncbi:MAG: PD-(D/E)XK nuclease family protein [Prevotella sp.]|nr:PD-(D/E)XK nuclease family protein [Prevotella sp.]MCM1075024.1 PD-(D/E)XK nuclease family protein [Ruminococcus sp.]